MIELKVHMLISLLQSCSTYQSQLPADGIQAVDLSPTSQGRVKAMFEDYVKAMSLANWKFWIVSLFLGVSTTYVHMCVGS